MHIHRFEKIWIGLSLFLIACFIGIVMYGFAVLDLKVPGIEESETVDPLTLHETEFSVPGTRQVGDNKYEVYMVARQFLFMPGTGQPLVLPEGAEVKFHVTSPDVLHGLHLAGTNVNVTVVPGQVSKFTTRFSEPGEYGMICHEYCGPAHHTMEGLIKVVPKSEFDSQYLVDASR
jgi:cytochrome c oxidase subunit 2